MAKNISKRGKIYYVVAQVNGKRVSQSLDTTDVRIAEQRAKAIIRAAKAEKWEQIQGVKGRGPAVPTVGECVERYERMARARYVSEGNPKPETVANYVGALRKVLEVGLGTDADVMGRPITILTPDLAADYVTAVVSPARDRDRARRTAASNLVQARSVFARWARPEGLPRETLAFLATKVRREKRKYRMPAADLVARTLAAGRALREVQPDLYAAFLLCYDLGLRRSEAVNARRDWVRETADGARYLDVIRRPEYNPKTERSVPISKSVWAHLECVAGPDYLMPADTITSRINMINRSLSAWMRTLGWDRVTYPKAAHELRKLIGSEWYTRYGVEVAADWLGHSNISTTHTYYADLVRHPDPIEIDG